MDANDDNDDNANIYPLPRKQYVFYERVTLLKVA